MSPHRMASLLLIILACVLLVGCSDDTAGLVQKIADMEKRVQKQEKDLKDFAGKFSPPKDFSADIQRIEDQQDKIQQTLKTKVEPVNNKLEEFKTGPRKRRKTAKTWVRNSSLLSLQLLKSTRKLKPKSGTELQVRTFLC